MEKLSLKKSYQLFIALAAVLCLMLSVFGITARAEAMPFTLTLSDGTVCEMTEDGTITHPYVEVYGSSEEDYPPVKVYVCSVPAGTETVDVTANLTSYSAFLGHKDLSFDLKGRSIAVETNRSNCYWMEAPYGEYCGVYFKEADPTPEPAKGIAISDKAFAANQTYSTFYHQKDTAYTYNGKAVTFIDGNTVQVEGESATRPLRNSETEVSVKVEAGKATITLTNVTRPVTSIPGEWNSSYKGDCYLSYKSDIDGKAAVQSASENLTTIEITDLKAGTYNLTGGSVFEACNEYSPGHDFGDGLGVVTEGYFGTLPDISFTIEASEPEPEPTETIAINDKAFAANQTYSTFYHQKDAAYTYNGKAVTFVDEYNVQVEGESATRPLKNKETEVGVKVEGGKATITLTNVTRPVPAISGEWNPDFGGKWYLNYKSDIAGKAVVQSASENLTTIEITDLKAGTYNLTDGSVFEACNEWSPGHDFGDGLGVVTEGYFGTLPDISFTVGEVTPVDTYLGTKTEAKVYDDWQNDLWLQYDQKEMKVGDTASIRPWRLEQIISNPIANDVARPDFNFEIISGDSITLDKQKTNDKAAVTAVKPGTTIVKVTYDTMSYKGREFGASSPVNTAYATFTVGEEGTAKISHSITERHYDTIYYSAGETTPYTFTVDATGAESLKVTCNGLPITGEGNSYTAALENRANIISIIATDAQGKTKSVYKVVDARFIQVVTSNADKPGEAIKTGDKVHVSFKGITMPVYKLATIYNPMWPSKENSGTIEEASVSTALLAVSTPKWNGEKANTADVVTHASVAVDDAGTCVVYENDKQGIVKGFCRQWDLATQNTITMTFDEAGTYDFTKGCIHSSWWGSELGADITANGSGEPNLGAPTLEDYFSKLPDFSVEVAEGTAVESITLNKETMDLYIGESETLTATLKPDATAQKEVKFSSNENYVATVDQNGKVTAIGTGTAIITATAGNKTATCSVTVSPVKAESVTLDPKEMTLESGQKATLKATVIPENATNKILTWSSSEETVAKVDYDGTVTAYAPGQAIITAEVYDGKSGQCIVTVTGKESSFKATVTPEVAYPGDEVTVSFVSLPIPEEATEPIWELRTVYNTNIKGLEKIMSQDASENTKALNTLTFTIPEGTASGNYSLSNGCVYANYGGHRVQGSFLVGNIEKNFYETEMPLLSVTVKDKAAKAVNDAITALPAEDALTSDDTAAVIAAKAGFDALDESQKAEIPAEVKAQLENAVSKIAEINHTALTPDGKRVTISAEDGSALPIDMKLVVGEAEDENSSQIASEANPNKEALKKLSIKLVNAVNGEAMEPAGNLKVTIEQDLTGYDTAGLIICHIKADKTSENLVGSYDEKGKTISFITSSTSDFVIMAAKTVTPEKPEDPSKPDAGTGDNTGNTGTTGTTGTTSSNTKTGVEGNTTAVLASVLCLMALASLGAYGLNRKKRKLKNNTAQS